MIPYFQQPSLHLFGPVTIHAFGFLVAMAVIAGSKLALIRCGRRKMDPDVCAGLIFSSLFASFLVAHVYSVLAYFPRQALEDPLMLLKFWENISSFGGMVGGVLGIWLFFRFRAPGLDARTRWVARTAQKPSRLFVRMSGQSIVFVPGDAVMVPSGSG